MTHRVARNRSWVVLDIGDATLIVDADVADAVVKWMIATQSMLAKDRIPPLTPVLIIS